MISMKLFIGIFAFHVIICTYGITNALKQDRLVGQDNNYWKGREYPSNHRMSNISIPFYLYSGGDFDVFWKNCDAINWSKGVEVSWLLRLQDHPWRVKEPTKALLFVVPALFSVALYAQVNNDLSICRQTLTNMSDTLHNALYKSPYFDEKNGFNHLMVVSYFKAQKYLNSSPKWKSTIRKVR
jgi:hypothetical protein